MNVSLGTLFNLTSTVLSWLVGVGTIVYDSLTLPFSTWFNVATGGYFDWFLNILSPTFIGRLLDNYSLGALVLGGGIVAFVAIDFAKVMKDIL